RGHLRGKQPSEPAPALEPARRPRERTSLTRALDGSIAPSVPCCGKIPSPHRPPRTKHSSIGGPVMTSWEGRRHMSVVSAVMRADGCPDFAINHVEVTHEEAENGIHYYLVDAMLMEKCYEEPFVHFDEMEAPAFLHPAVKEYLSGAQPSAETTNS